MVTTDTERCWEALVTGGDAFKQNQMETRDRAGLGWSRGAGHTLGELEASVRAGPAEGWQIPKDPAGAPFLNKNRCWGEPGKWDPGPRPA